MPKWIHDRAMSMKKDMEKTYGKDKAEQVAFAVATQQAHKLGKSPKTFVSRETGKKERFGTTLGRAVAKAKFDKPKSEYKKTAGKLDFVTKPMRGEKLDPESEDYAKNRALGKAIGSGGAAGWITGAGAGVGGSMLALRKKIAPHPLLVPAAALGGATLGGVIGTAAAYPKKLKKEKELQERKLQKKLRKKASAGQIKIAAFADEFAEIITC